MKQAKLFFLALCTFGLSLSVYADKSECDDSGFGPAVHCAYTSGSKDGFILVKIIMNNESEVDCLPSNFAVSIEQDDANTQKIGQNLWSFQECTNKDCSSSMPLLTDSFILKSNHGMLYQAFPATFGFNVDMSKGVSCTFCPTCTHRFVKIK